MAARFNDSVPLLTGETDAFHFQVITPRVAAQVAILALDLDGELTISAIAGRTTISTS
jgi:hypothetical protein